MSNGVDLISTDVLVISTSEKEICTISLRKGYHFKVHNQVCRENYVHFNCYYKQGSVYILDAESGICVKRYPYEDTDIPATEVIFFIGECVERFVKDEHLLKSFFSYMSTPRYEAYKDAYKEMLHAREVILNNKNLDWRS